MVRRAWGPPTPRAKAAVDWAVKHYGGEAAEVVVRDFRDPARFYPGRMLEHAITGARAAWRTGFSIHPLNLEGQELDEAVAAYTQRVRRRARRLLAARGR